MKTSQQLFARAIGGCMLLTVTVISHALAEDDQIYMKRGPGVSGKVVASTTSQVAIESRGNTEKVSVNEVRLITFGDEPQELRRGRAGAAAGNYAAALDDLQRVNPENISRLVVKQDLQFYLALCRGRQALTSGGDKSSASAAMLAFVRAVPQSYHFFDAAQLLGDLSVARGDYDAAVRFYGAIASKAPWPEYKMNAILLEARALVAQGEYAGALKKYDSVMGQPSDTPQAQRQKLFAQIGKGRCLAETGAADEGIRLIEQVIAENDATDAELFGRAYNAHGDCLQKVGKSKDALMSYLHVDVLFYSDPEIHAESLYHLTNLWTAMKKPDRAAVTRNLLDKRYAGSVWAKMD